MTVSPPSQESAYSKSLLLVLAAGGLLLAASGCNNSASQQGGAHEPGTIVAASSGRSIIVDANNLGLASDLRIVSTFWGRLVDVFGLDALGERTLMQEDFLIGPALVTTLGSYILETSAVTGGQSLVIERDVTDASPGGGRAQFFSLLRAAEANLAPLSDQGGGGAGIFTMVPRNATVVVIFDDLLDPNLITRTTIRTFTGSPPTAIYDSRVFADPNHGDVIDINGSMIFYPTRAYIDPTISELESISDNQGLSVNTSGFPASLDANLSNVSLQLPTVEDFLSGQTTILKNRSGHELATTLNGSVDLSTTVMPVVRDFRSGGRQSVTGDPFNGFLPDMTPPQVVGSQGGFITSPPMQFAGDDEDEFTLPTYQFSSAPCAQTPVVGDVICQTDIFAEVIENALPPDVTGLVQNMRVRLLAFPPGFASPADWIATAVGSATFVSPFDPVADTGKQACFVRVTPAPAMAPATGISTDSRFGVQFGEPMDRESFSAFDSMVLSRTGGTSNADLLIGRIENTLDLLRYTYIPTMLLAHAAGGTEPYTFHLDPGAIPPTDLAGNSLATPLPPATFTVELGQNVQHNGGHVTRFSSIDEEAPIGDVANGEAPLPEFSGQHFYDTALGIIRPRAVTRFEAVADRTQPVFALSIPANQGSPTPLSSSGSKLQAFWRPVDLNLTYDDPTRYNLDVEGLNWAPYQDLVSTDHFANFEIRLAHGRFSPDEYVCPGPPAFALFANSGVVSRFQDNLLSLTEDPLTLVHEKFRGFSIAPGQIFASATGTRLVPYPLNQGIPADQHKYYTWRDTGILTRGGVAGSGPTDGNGVYIPLEVPPYTFHVTVSNPFNLCLPTDTTLATDVLWEEDLVQSVALPLLMEFKCFPDNGASSSNLGDTTFTQNTNFRPFFRAFSTGGVGTTGPVQIDPDLESVANGGFNPATNQATPGNDRVTHVGSIDLVVRISRSYSIWRLANEPGSPNTSFLSPRFGVPVLEPENADQPNGTSVQVAMRGASAITNFLTNAPEARDALSLDAYGDWYNSAETNHSVPLPNPRIAEFNNDASWHDADPEIENPTGLDGAQYYQLRVTFQSNPVSGLVPSLSAIGITWKE